MMNEKEKELLERIKAILPEQGNRVQYKPLMWIIEELVKVIEDGRVPN